MRRAALSLACLASILVQQRAVADPARAKDMTAFWLWAGVRPQAAMAGARRVYLLQGEVMDHPMVHLEARRPAVPHVAGPCVWMVIRTDTLAWPADTYTQVLHAVANWRAAGNAMQGLEIDFDAETRGLLGYATFLRDLRARLPGGVQLGVTGLLDWSANGDPGALDTVAGTVDEVVLQTYQGRHVIPGYATYLERLQRLHVPFRIGILQGGDWTPPPALIAHPFYRGTVMFLRNEGER